MSPPTRSRRILLATPAVAGAALILFLSSRPGSQVPATGIAYGDKLEHVAEYFVYGLLLLLPMRGLGWRGRILALGAGLVFAALDEGFQTTVPGRVGDLADWAADGAGLVFAVILAVAVSRRGADSAKRT